MDGWERRVVCSSGSVLCDIVFVGGSLGRVLMALLISGDIFSHRQTTAEVGRTDKLELEFIGGRDG